ncbi:MAG TPA: HlyD family efflux transporter periplasmic adaptor subunit [Noviherbaspirillum sp.]|jgi:membrane fusion protein|uniref:HlyD family secretion protein n=1 Tax=Noviherbaspirillum sp. TaxID=1926288 RepID=UPI002F947E96
MAKDNTLFRTEAVHARAGHWMGDIVLARPLSFTLMCGGALACATAVILFLTTGSYTRRSTVSGQLMPATGLVKVHAPQAGVIVDRHVAEGQAVKRGDVLYTLSGERHSSTQGSTHALVSEQLRARRQSLQEERDKHRILHREEHAALGRRIESLQREMEKLDGQIAGQETRVRLAEETRARHAQLLAQAYISREHLQQKDADVLDQRNRLQNLERERMAAARELASQRHEYGSLGLRHENQQAQVERAIVGIEQELTENEARRHLAIRAPESGIATAAIAEPGQSVDPARPLVSIVPEGAVLQAHLYAQSRAVGFVRPGDAVLLRYVAYPYQKFGHAQGTVADVARTALPGDELAGDAAIERGEPVYRITVRLAAQAVVAYGRPQALQSGMRVEADVLQETRRLYEWVLEPLYSMGRKL